jgi:hypothetical protein
MTYHTHTVRVITLRGRYMYLNMSGEADAMEVASMLANSKAVADVEVWTGTKVYRRGLSGGWEVSKTAKPTRPVQHG